MTKQDEFREPVFVRNDNTTEIEASVVVWAEWGRSVKLRGMSGTVLINEDDWKAVVSCINHDLDRLAF